MASIFKDRREAGRVLAQVVRRELDEALSAEDAIVLGLPRGGVPVAFEVARELNLRLMFWWSVSWEFPARKSWRWARLPAGASW